MKQLRRTVGVQINRDPNGLCRHARKVQAWVKRRGIELQIENSRNPDEIVRLKAYLQREYENA